MALAIAARGQEVGTRAVVQSVLRRQCLSAGLRLERLTVWLMSLKTRNPRPPKRVDDALRHSWPRKDAGSLESSRTHRRSAPRIAHDFHALGQCVCLLRVHQQSPFADCIRRAADDSTDTRNTGGRRLDIDDAEWLELRGHDEAGCRLEQAFCLCSVPWVREGERAVQKHPFCVDSGMTPCKI